MKTFFQFIFIAISTIFSFLWKVACKILTKENFEKLLKVVFTKTFLFIILSYLTVCLVRTLSVDQNYGVVSNFLFPVVKDPGQTFVILLIGFSVFTIWCWISVKNKKFDFF